MCRASVSIAANIAEGYGRESTQSYIQFLRIAQGSVKELETHIEIARGIGMIEESLARELETRCDSIGRMLRALVRSLDAKI